jgi:hypothetical protein
MSRALSAALALALLPLSLPVLAQDGATATDYSSFVPDSGLFTATEEPPDTELVRRLFTLAFSEECGAAIDGGYGGTEPEVYDLEFKPSYLGADEPAYPFRLYRFNCSAGAYNVNSVYYGWDSMDGVRPIGFAVPSIEVTYKDELSEQVDTFSQIGFETRRMVTNSAYDPASQTIVGGAYWRGLGDASELGVWRFREGRFVLERYEVDPSYNGEVDPTTLLDFTRPDDPPAPGRPSFEEEEGEVGEEGDATS